MTIMEDGPSHKGPTTNPNQISSKSVAPDPSAPVRGQFAKCDNCGSGPWNTGWDPDADVRKSKKFYCPNCLGAD